MFGVSLPMVGLSPITEINDVIESQHKGFKHWSNLNQAGNKKLSTVNGPGCFMSPDGLLNQGGLPKTSSNLPSLEDTPNPKQTKEDIYRVEKNIELCKIQSIIIEEI